MVPFFLCYTGFIVLEAQLWMVGLSLNATFKQKYCTNDANDEYPPPARFSSFALFLQGDHTSPFSQVALTT